MSEISQLSELVSSWERIKNSGLPVFIYGMGDGCLKLMREFDKYGIAVSGIFASDEFVRGHSFWGHLVHKLSEVENALGCGNFIIAMAFAAGYDSLIRQIDEIAQRNILIVPDTDVIGVGAFTKKTLSDNIESIEKVYSLLADDKSRQVYVNVLKYKITGDISFLRECCTPPDEAYANIIRPAEDEIYVDLGAYNGDTIRELLSHTGGRYEKIYALEPDKRNFRKLSEYAESMKNIELYNAAAWLREDTLNFNAAGGRQGKLSSKGVETAALSVDGILQGGRATYIKYDVEGAEREALEGTEKTIEKYAPKLCVALYHRAEDIFELPVRICEMCPKYKLYVRHYPYYPAWETNLFAVCE